jgi:hypothetical protein
MEYAPAPPCDAGRPETAPAEIVTTMRARMDALAKDRVAGAREAARRLAEA